MKKQIIFLLINLVFIGSCKKETDNTNSPNPAYIEIYSDAVFAGAQDFLISTVTDNNTGTRMCFYGDFDGNGAPEQVKSVIVTKPNNDTTVHHYFDASFRVTKTIYAVNETPLPIFLTYDYLPNDSLRVKSFLVDNVNNTTTATDFFVLKQTGSSFQLLGYGKTQASVISQIIQGMGGVTVVVGAAAFITGVVVTAVFSNPYLGAVAALEVWVIAAPSNDANASTLSAGAIPSGLPVPLADNVLYKEPATNTTLTVNFSGSPTNIQPGGSVSFTDLSNPTPDSWQWSFPGGNPSSSSSQNPTVTYSTVGNYDVTLVVTKNGSSTSKNVNNYIKVDTVPCAISCPATVTDIDGNTYNVVKIGCQCWTQENLKTTRYRDGSAITEIEDSLTWVNIYNTSSQSPAWCYYGGNAANNTTYGKLYNWYAVADPRNVCPTGWHVPTLAEFRQLTDYLGGETVAGGKMKAISLWTAPNIGADNASGFTALPAGYRLRSGTFDRIGLSGNFWSASEFDAKSAYPQYLSYIKSDVNYYGTSKEDGFSVRCVRD